MAEMEDTVYTTAALWDNDKKRKSLLKKPHMTRQLVFA